MKKLVVLIVSSFLLSGCGTYAEGGTKYFDLPNGKKVLCIMTDSGQAITCDWEGSH